MLSRRWVLAVTVATTVACDVPAWRRAVEAYWREYPLSQPADLYKFAHQGILGSEHAVPDAASTADWMSHEVAGLSSHPKPPPHQAPLVETLPPDGRFVRVHLRPFLSSGGRTDELLRAFVATANGRRGDTAQFACVEQALVGMGSGQAALAFLRARRIAGFNAVHHSAAFEKAYAPAYRVVGEGWLEKLLGARERPPSRRD